MSWLRLEQKRQLINLIRQFFSEKGFFEIETPLLVRSPGMEVHLHGFKTQYEGLDGRMFTCFLPTSPEFAIKKALGRGHTRVFEIARVFRNKGELGPLHHPEFNMLEWYRSGNYGDIMLDTEELISFIADNFKGIQALKGFSWQPPFPRRTVKDLFSKYANMDLVRGMTEDGYWKTAAAKALGRSFPEDDTFDDIFFKIWLELIEPHLGFSGPEIIYDYPASMAALARIKVSDPQWAERFELYIKGLEIGNAFSELIDPEEQAERFHKSNEERQKLGFPPHPPDEDLIKAVGKMPPTGGIAIGVERLLMALSGEQDIRQCFLIPFEPE